VKVLILDFLRTGLFGDVEIGMDRTDILSLVGPPDDWSIDGATLHRADPWATSTTWKYGGIQLGFGREGRLVHIHSSLVGELVGGAQIDIDPWILQRGVLREVIEEQLMRANIGYEEIEPFLNGTTVLRVGPGIELTFVEEAVPGLSVLGLDSFSYVRIIT
jgi:hypothetical protein